MTSTICPLTATQFTLLATTTERDYGRPSTRVFLLAQPALEGNFQRAVAPRVL